MPKSKSKSKYFIRINSTDTTAFYKATDSRQITFNIMSADISGTLFSIDLEEEDATALRLAFPFIGFLNWTRLWKKPSTTCT